MCMYAYSVLIIVQTHGRMLYVHVCLQCVDHRPGSQEETICVHMLTVC